MCPVEVFRDPANPGGGLGGQVSVDERRLPRLETHFPEEGREQRGVTGGVGCPRLIPAESTNAQLHRGLTNPPVF
eukprot:792304-Pyramimonas_sp.AAC.1